MGHKEMWSRKLARARDWGDFKLTSIRLTVESALRTEPRALPRDLKARAKLPISVPSRSAWWTAAARQRPRPRCYTSISAVSPPPDKTVPLRKFNEIDTVAWSKQRLLR